MKGYLLDTNHVGRAVRRQSVVLRRIYEERRRGWKIGTCIPVLCEIEAGRLNVSHPDAYFQDLKALLRKIRVWPLTLETAKCFGTICHDLQRRGRVLSQVDMIVAALCRELDLTLVTTDKDFAALAWLKTENWS